MTTERTRVNENSPLLPKTTPSSASVSSVALNSVVISSNDTWKNDLRRRKSTKKPFALMPVNNNHDEENYDDEDYGDSARESGSDGDELDDRMVQDRLRDHRRPKRDRPLSYASDSSATPQQTLGLAKRKPRWSGFRNKIASISNVHNGVPATSREMKPRVVGRRGRFRSSDYAEAMRISRQSMQPLTNSPMARIAAYCTCDQIALFKLLKWLEKSAKEAPTSEGTAKFHLPGWTNKMYMGVIHASFNPQNVANANDMPPLQLKDAFYFATGCCVFWGLTREEELRHIRVLESFSSGPVKSVEAEDMQFTYGDTSYIANDAIFLSSNRVAEKLAISFALAQSAKLDVFEERVEERIRNTKHIPFNLATTGSIQYSQTDISKLIGQLFIELADVNLHSDILDEPDFFWEDDEYEPLYKRMVKYLDVSSRVKILNKRLDILRELVEVLNQELTQQHGTKLEWIIIWLLVAEIILSVGWNIILKDILGFFHH